MTTKGKRGGPRHNSGKKSVDGNSKGAKMVLVYLHEDEKEFFRTLGNGFVSPGVRIAKQKLEDLMEESRYKDLKGT